MKIVKKLIHDLLPADYNPRKDLQPGDVEYEQLKRSVQEFGYVEPVIYNIQTGVVVGGHQRLKVLQDLGYTEIECVEVDIPEPQEKALNIALNKISGDWDTVKLKDLLEDLQGLDVDLELTGFTAADLDGLGLDTSILDIPEEKHIEEDDFDPLAEVPKRVKLGDLWRLGEHLLYCGDSLDPNSYKTLMGDTKADLTFTDPPYGMKKEKDGVENDNLNYDDLLEFNKKWIPLTFEYTKDNGSWYCWGIDEPLMDIYSHILKPMIKNNQITFRNLITWDKGNGQGQLSEDFRMYPTADEKCLFVMFGVQGADGVLDSSETLKSYLCYMTEEVEKSKLTIKDLNEICGYKSIASHWTLNLDGTQKQPRLIQEKDYKTIQEYCKSNNIHAFKREYDAIKREWYSTRAYFNNTHDNMNNVWHFDRSKDEERALTGGHATPKPLALCGRAIKSSSRENEIVLDAFGGSGSTLIACEQLGRKCRMIELTEHYCDVIINRWEVLTGKKAEKIER